MSSAGESVRVRSSTTQTDTWRVSSSPPSTSEPPESAEAAPMAASTMAWPSWSSVWYDPAQPRSRPRPRVELSRTNAPVRL
ncbi:MAG: hypothetical protein J07HB67_01526 [halophilic archaeon J07HB67]|nr:MAG: hypothetical protein J07HB67_01526 [halophilic archaeon J07HB67]